jgi:anti-sigma factor RsiW
MNSFSRSDAHEWAQNHLSHYVEGDLSRRARRRFDRHADECVDCGRGKRAMRALVRLLPQVERHGEVEAPADVFDRVRADRDSRPDR